MHPTLDTAPRRDSPRQISIAMRDGTSRTLSQLLAAERIFFDPWSSGEARDAAVAELTASPLLRHQALVQRHVRDASCSPRPEMAGLGGMAHHFEALEMPAERRRRQTRLVAGLMFIGFALAVAAHVALAAPGKIARTGALFVQIEEGRKW